MSRERVCELARELLDDGLVVRTWGNVSARDGERFVVTPSGRRYETMTGDDLACVDADGEWDGPLKPSGEAPMHGAIYERFPEAGCVVHTHQAYASALSFAASPIRLTAEEAALLGQVVLPVAPYALPTTAGLHRNVEATLEEFPVRVVLLKAHGALIWAADANEARRLANALEDVARARYFDALSHHEPAPREVFASERTSSGIRYLDASGAEATPDAATRANHERIYAARAGVGAVVGTRDSEVAQYFGCKLRPYLDDFAQLVGLAATPSERSVAILTRDEAYCTGRDLDDAHAVRTVLEKNARAARYAKVVGGKPINVAEALLMRAIYVGKYAKQAG